MLHIISDWITDIQFPLVIKYEMFNVSNDVPVIETRYITIKSYNEFDSEQNKMNNAAYYEGVSNVRRFSILWKHISDEEQWIWSQIENQ